VSPGWVAGLRAQAARLLETRFLPHVRALIAAAPVAHADETTARAAGTLTYLHVACTRFLTAMHVGDRSRDTIDAGGVWPGFTGVLVRDGYAGYEHLDQAVHAWCGIHLVRDLRAVHDPDPAGQSWAEAMVNTLLLANATAHTARAEGRAALTDAELSTIGSRYAEGRGELWWIALEEVIARHAEIETMLDRVERVFDCSTAEAKQQSFETIYRHIRAKPTDEDLRQVIRELAFAYGVDMGKLCRDLCLDWEEIAGLAADPLVTIGAHTVSHPILAKLTAEAARAEILDGSREITRVLGRSPTHFAYPVGTPDAAGVREFALAAGAGFKTAVTTRPGVLFPDHVRHLTALPRISVNGDFQRLRYLDVLLSGAPTALLNRFRRVDAA